MNLTEFADGWKHFCDCIDFGHSNLDAEAIKFMNEMPGDVAKGLTQSEAPGEPETYEHDGI